MVRLNPEGITETSLETDVAIGEIPIGAIEAFRALIADLYLPLLAEDEHSKPSPSLQVDTFRKVVDLQKTHLHIPMVLTLLTLA